MDSDCRGDPGVPVRVSGPLHRDQVLISQAEPLFSSLLQGPGPANPAVAVPPGVALGQRQRQLHHLGRGTNGEFKMTDPDEVAERWGGARASPA